MLLPDWAVLNAAIEWLAHGMWNLAWWQIILFTLAMTHVTMISVTVFLHRHQAHRALDLHPIAAHFFPFLVVADDGSGHQGVGLYSPQAPRQVRAG